MGAIIKCNNLSKKYSGRGLTTQALDAVSLEIEKGSVNLIYGKSGSGKTTLLNIMAGLDGATSGDVGFEDVWYSSLKEHELAKLRGENFGFVFQAYNLIQGIKVAENIKTPSYITGKKVEKDYYDYLVEKLGIVELLKKYPNELSGGQQQRVAIARALVLKPQVVFADEPTGNLDTENTGMITDLFEGVHDELKTTLIVVTHEENLLKNCDMTIRIKDGMISDEKSRTCI